MARDLYGEMLGRALSRQAPSGHMAAYITPNEAFELRSGGGGVPPGGGQYMANGIPSFQSEPDYDLGGADMDLGAIGGDIDISDPDYDVSDYDGSVPGYAVRGTDMWTRDPGLARALTEQYEKDQAVANYRQARDAQLRAEEQVALAAENQVAWDEARPESAPQMGATVVDSTEKTPQQVLAEVLENTTYTLPVPEIHRKEIEILEKRGELPISIGSRGLQYPRSLPRDENKKGTFSKIVSSLLPSLRGPYRGDVDPKTGNINIEKSVSPRNLAAALAGLLAGPFVGPVVNRAMRALIPEDQSLWRSASKSKPPSVFDDSDIEEAEGSDDQIILVPPMQSDAQEEEEQQLESVLDPPVQTADEIDDATRRRILANILQGLGRTDRPTEGITAFGRGFV
jgi:hypothetical protein